MNTMFGLFNLGGGEIILILALILILFGAKKLPELAKGLGQGIKEFKKATKEVTDEVQSAMDEPHSPPPQKRLPPSTPQTSQPEHAEQPETVAHSSSPGTKA
jgi:sec-independent protein translocase protein TatA